MCRVLKRNIVVLSFLLLIFSCKTGGQAEKFQNRDSSLKTFAIRHGRTELRSLLSPINKNIIVQLEKNIDNQDYIKMIATAKDATAKIIFDSDVHSNNAKKYATFVAEVDTLYHSQTPDSKAIYGNTEIDMSKMAFYHYLHSSTASLSGKIIPLEMEYEFKN